MHAITSVVTGQIILAYWAIFLLFWAITALFVKHTVENRRNMAAGVFIRFGIAVIVILVISQHWPLISTRLWLYSTTAGIIADIIAGCGLALLLWSRVILGRNWSASIVLKENHELIRRGPYALIRHPIYTGLALLFLGEALWYANIAWLAVFVILFITVYIKAGMEEVFLTQYFPNEYPQYKARTKALIPFLL